MTRARFAKILGGGLLAIVLVFAGCQWNLSDRIVGMVVRSRFQAFPELPANGSPPRPKSPNPPPLPLNSDDLFLTRTIWPVHLDFAREQWLAMSPENIPPVAEPRNPNGTRRLRNPAAKRAGMLGVFGMELPWSVVRRFDFADSAYTNVAIRFKGNGTFIESMRSYRRSYKIDLNDYAPRQNIAGITKLNLNNLSQDVSFMQEALATEYYRDVGLPACRTAYATVSLSIESVCSQYPVGLYLIVENLDSKWAKHRFKADTVAIWKPVTTELFLDRGTNWLAHKGEYQPRDNVQPEDESRLIQFSQLVTHASDHEFRSQVDAYLDLDQFSKFLAAEVLTSNYDSFLGLGQNYILILNRTTERFSMLPWDLDHGWGEFFLVGSLKDKVEASISHPWVGKNRFLQRILDMPKFQHLYRTELKRQLDLHFTEERLFPKIDSLADILRPHLAGESEQRIRRFETAISENSPSKDYSLKRFISARRTSVLEQLAGKSEGKILTTIPFF